MIYQETYSIAKNGSSVPLYSDGTAAHSKYDPQKEASTFGSSVSKDTGCFVVGGIAGAFHLQSLHAAFPEALIIAFEADETSLSFCRQNTIVQTLTMENTIIFCTAETLTQTIMSHYLPAVHNSFALLFLRSWQNKNESLVQKCEQTVQSLLKTISADYSVQAHFGRLWQRSIFLNAEFLSSYDTNATRPCFPVEKKAAIIAAGPSLDSSITTLLLHRNEYFIFSTDTSYGTLLKQGVTPDAVVSIDGQAVSATHFYCCPNASQNSKQTVFFFDLCASPSAVKFVFKKGHRVFFIQSGHPLSSAIFDAAFVPHVSSGSGTVTIACCDIARQFGFSTIELFGADFCYNEGKAYTKGTYLESNFNQQAIRLAPSEFLYDALMFRVPLTPFKKGTLFSGMLRNALTSDILQGYASTLLSWAETNQFIHKGSCLCSNKKEQHFFQHTHQRMHENPFAPFFSDSLRQSLPKSLHEACSSKTVVALLPYIAWLKSHTANKKLSFFDLLKLAYSDAVRYTRNYHE